MATSYKSWAVLGLSTTLLGSMGLAACGNDQGSASPESEASQPAETTPPSAGLTDEIDVALAPVRAEGGEGEGGVNIAAAGEDPAVYLSALAVVEAHIRAGIDALDAGERKAAAEMFAHPVSEILFDLEPVLRQQGVPDFGQKLIDASHGVFGGESDDALRARANDIIATIRQAGERAPDSQTGEIKVKAYVIADEIDRAIAQYISARNSDAYEPYLDGYGFYKTAESLLVDNAAMIAAGAPSFSRQATDVLAALSEAYPSARRPDTLDADVSHLAVLNSELQLELSGL